MFLCSIKRKFILFFGFYFFFICLGVFLFYPIFVSESIIFPFSLSPFDICKEYPVFWEQFKKTYVFSYLLSSIIYSKFFCSILFSKKSCLKKNNLSNDCFSSNELSLILGKSENNSVVRIPLKGLYQNILVTGTIGTGKTSGVMYPFTQQLIHYKCFDQNLKFGMLILDVKGNFHNYVLDCATRYSREDDIIFVELGKNFKYNPLDKPNLKPSVIANRLKTILTLFSENNSDSYWLEKVEQVLTEAIKFCRIYNNGYVTFQEIHNLITDSNYFYSKYEILRKIFQSGKLSPFLTYDLLSSINFFENEFNSLDSRTLSIIKSEITRITNVFISDYEVLQTFSPTKNEITFNGFKDVLDKGKIVVLKMNIAEYRNLSKIIAAYLKLDFQTEILSLLKNSSQKKVRSSVFICDEYHEYVTATDSSFFAQSREAKCINIVATQSYSSLLETIKNEATVKVIIQNLTNKIWLRNDDLFTIESAQKQIGKEYKSTTVKSISENAKETNFNYFTNTLNSEKSSISETISEQITNDYIYDINFFTQSLETFSCLAFLSDGLHVEKPLKITLFPSFSNFINNSL